MSKQRGKRFNTDKPPTTIPDDLNSPHAKLVYHSLDVGGTASVDELATRLNLGKMTLLAVLKTLEGRNLVDRRNERYIAVHD